jgi:hypothetical protein
MKLICCRQSWSKKPGVSYIAKRKVISIYSRDVSDYLHDGPDEHHGRVLLEPPRPHALDQHDRHEDDKDAAKRRVDGDARSVSPERKDERAGVGSAF